jgi:hypothetical protein
MHKPNPNPATKDVMLLKIMSELGSFLVMHKTAESPVIMTPKTVDRKILRSVLRTAEMLSTTTKMMHVAIKNPKESKHDVRMVLPAVLYWLFSA